jgi:group II intron reverse transcriptase/maturase
VDGVTFEAYERDLDRNLADLVERLKQSKYRAKLVRRKYIPKGNGKRRPLGIPALEDKLLQRAVANILSCIYEQDFCECSWGYRPNRSPREASRVLATELHRGRYGWLVEADIRGYFDHIDHEWLTRMLKLRIADRAFLGLIVKWLKAGVLEEDGKIIHPATGSPQGGVVSPVLANVYLHYALDLWFEKVVKKYLKGEAYILRFADDFVCAFTHYGDAKRFEAVLYKRLAKFGLEVAEEKTQTLRFSRFGNEANGVFTFVGFEFRWVRRRSGKMGVARYTCPKKQQASMRNLTEWIRKHRHQRITPLMHQVRRKLQGYQQYYGVRGNSRRLSQVFEACKKLLFKWLNRRSDKSSYTWKGFVKVLRFFRFPAPHIVEKEPRTSGLLFV